MGRLEVREAAKMVVWLRRWGEWGGEVEGRVEVIQALSWGGG